MKETITLDLEQQFKVPRVPNFIILVNGNKIPLKEFSNHELDKIGEAFTKNLKERASEQRETSDN